MYTEKELFMYEKAREVLEKCYLNSKEREIQVNTCNAWYKIIGQMVLLKSYSTLVATIFGNTCYVYGFYSNTTQSHIRKLCKHFNVEVIVYLYNRSDRKNSIYL